MPAPTASAITDAIEANLNPAQFPTPYQTNFQDLLTQIGIGLNAGWANWQSGLTGGKNTVSGNGLGTWTGTGSGGSIEQSSPLTFSIDVPEQPPQFLVFASKVVNRISAEFTAWANSFVFSSTPYQGTSTASGGSSGTFNATGANPPAGIGTLGSGTNPPGVAALVKADLQAAGWDTTYANWRTAYLLSAIDAAIASLFATWLTATTFSGDTVTGTAAAGSGSGSATSSGNGTLT